METDKRRSPEMIGFALWLIAMSTISGVFSLGHEDGLLGWTEGLVFVLGTLVGAVGLGHELGKPGRA